MNDNKDQDDRVRQRLLARRDIDDQCGCWIYRGATTGNGYGHVRYNGGTEYAHRLAAMLFLALDLADGRVVRHTCDVPACFNPEHLRLGTQRDNIQDAVAKGRMSGKKLTEEQVSVIKYHLPTRTQRSLSLEYGVSTTAIGQIARGETWKTVTPKSPAPPERRDEIQPTRDSRRRSSGRST